MGGSRYKPGANYPTSLPPGEAVTLDPEAIDDLIRSQGVLFEHFESVRCPVGLIDKYDTMRRPHDHSGTRCSNGFLYERVGSFQGLLTGNSLNYEFKDQGGFDSSTAQLTAPRFYAPELGQDNKRVYLAPYDRLYYADENLLVTNWELVEASPTGLDRLLFPAVEITRIVDSQNISYCLGDYQIVEGNVKWIGSRQPGQDPETGKGRVYSVRYRYRPFWVVRVLGHELRTVNADDPLTGERKALKMQQSATLQREFLFVGSEERQTPPDASSARAAREPEDGGFGSK